MVNKDIGIAIIAPGGYAPDSSDFLRGMMVMESMHYKVFNYYDHEKSHQRFGGTDTERIRQIEEAVSNPEVQIVMALRGGYGTSRLLPHLDFSRLAQSGKFFVGHSDFTVFQMALLSQTKTASFAGPMVCNDFTRQDLSSLTLDHFHYCLTHPEISIQWADDNNPDVRVEGMLWGGNLTMLAHLAGTRWLPDIDGGILFVEDINEHPYRVERMLLQLDGAGILKKQKALVLGNFSEYRTSVYDNGYDFDTMLSWLRSRLSLPVLTGLPFGHQKDKVTLPVGASASLISKNGSIQMDLRDYPSIW